MNLTANANRVLESRYLRRDSQGAMVETPAELFRRVARAVSQAELMLSGPRQAGFWEKAFHDMLVSLEFLPNSPALMNAGTTVGQLSACFVLPVPDTIEGIFEALKQMALVQRTGGGTGFSFSSLRPRKDVVVSTGGEASGPVSFMKIFDCATENIRQGGRRRGANMGVLRVDHPDILEFVRAKSEEGCLGNFNISVGITDAFMQACRDDGTYHLIHPVNKLPTARKKARKIFDIIVDAAWRTGDPGLLFLDAINRSQPTPQLGEIEATNPCGEVPLLPYESCNLGSINLARMLLEHEGTVAIDWEKLRRRVRMAIRFLDDLLEINAYPFPELERMARGNRKVGLGVMGFAEMLIFLGISYDSEEAVQLADRLMHFIEEEARWASQDLAEERGVFPNWPGSRCAEEGLKVRNAARIAIAPTGTIGIIAGTSPSIEPLFALAYRRQHVLDGQTLFEVNPLLECYLQKRGLEAGSIMEGVREWGNLRDLKEVPESVKQLFVTALEISPRRHLQIQAAFQRHVDHSVSKTINLPESADHAAVAQAYLEAWEMGLKGVTIYRYGSKTSQVLEIGARESGQQYDHSSRCDPGECRL